MSLTDRMLMGSIANNPASFEGSGEYRCCRQCDMIFFTSAKQPDTTHDEHDWFALPALNPDGSKILERAFQRFIKRWSAERQEQLEKFAQRKGWDMAMELKYGGGALEEAEVDEWQKIVNGRLEQLVKQAREQLMQSASESQAGSTGIADAG
jgi:tRNA(Met) C34 N-acetyltransferase TmcA